MSETSPRFGLPLLEAGQAQKEITHNEALLLLEALVQPVAETLGDNTPPAAPAIGRSWITGAQPSGAWTGQPDALATWTAGGWRFVAAVDGMAVWIAAAGLWARRWSGAWQLGSVSATSLQIGGIPVVGARQPAIAQATGGTTVDVEARTALAAVLVALRTHGLIAT